MTDTDTTALRELLAKATPGRYVLDDHQVLVDSVEEDGFPSQTCVLEACIPVDAELATALHNAAPALLDELDRLRDENERLRAQLTNLSHILLDPEGNPSFHGSAGDHQIAVNAFAALEGKP